MQRIPVRKTDPMTSLYEADKSSDDWTLWVAGSSLELQRRLTRTNRLGSTILVQPVPEGDAQPLSERTLDFIAGILASRRVHSVIVCGQPGDAIAASPVTRNTQHDGAGPFIQLLQRVGARMERQRAVQDRVRAHLHQIRSHAGISSRLSLRSIRLCGMFYIPESDAFLVYEQATDRFVRLALSAVWGTTGGSGSA